MAGQTGADLAALQRTAQNQDEAINAAQRQLEQVTNQAEALAAGWTGVASGAFQGALHSFHENGEKVVQALRGMQESMTATHSTLANTHQNTQDIANRTKSSVGQPIGIAGL